MKTEAALSNALGVSFERQEILEPICEEQEPKKTSEVSLTNDAEDDYNLARETFRNMIEQGNSAMKEMMELAKQSESPRAYEVFATMMKTLSETTKDLYNLQKTTKELRQVDGKPVVTDPSINVEKAVFVGTSTELLDRIKATKI